MLIQTLGLDDLASKGVRNFVVKVHSSRAFEVVENRWDKKHELYFFTKGLPHPQKITGTRDRYGGF